MPGFIDAFARQQLDEMVALRRKPARRRTRPSVPSDSPAADESRSRQQAGVPVLHSVRTPADRVSHLRYTVTHVRQRLRRARGATEPAGER